MKCSGLPISDSAVEETLRSQNIFKVGANMDCIHVLYKCFENTAGIFTAWILLQLIFKVDSCRYVLNKYEYIALYLNTIYLRAFKHVQKYIGPNRKRNKNSR